MITVDQRKAIEAQTFSAIKAMTSEQLQVKMIAYTDVTKNANNGNFRVETNKPGIFYDVKIEQGDIVSLLRVYVYIQVGVE